MLLNTRSRALLMLTIMIALLALLPWASRMALAATLTVTNLNDAGAGSLRQAIIDANINPGADTITFAAATNGGTIGLASALPDLANSGALTIIGNGAANTLINGNNAVSVFVVAVGANVNISGVLITGGAAGAADGGGIRNNGTLTLTSSVVDGNSATNGGGIYNGPKASLTVNNSSISSNLAGDGGGIFAFSSTLTINNSTLDSNSAAVGGGLFINDVITTLNNSIIANSISGGGNDCSRLVGTFTLQNSLIEDGSCGIVGGVNGNLTGDPALGPTLIPLVGSIVIDAGLNGLIPAGITTDLAGNLRIQGARVDLGAYEFGSGAPRPTITLPPTITPTVTPLPLPTVTPPVFTINRQLLPLVLKAGTQPDLVVDQIALNPSKSVYKAGEPVQFSVRVSNIGDAPASGFWVDIYFNPSPPPDAGNQRWNERCGLNPCYGAAWAVAGLAPGSSIVLTSAQIDRGQSVWPGFFAPGTSAIYAFADSFNLGVSTGAVLERDETNNRLLLSGLSVIGSLPAQAPAAAHPVLPPRVRP